MKLSLKIAQNTLVQVASKVVSTALGLVALAVMTRYLGKNGYGEYTTVITFLTFFSLIADLGLTLVTVQMISAPDADENKILNGLFTLRLISAVIFLGLAPLAAFFFPYEPAIKIGILLTTLSFVFVALNQILVGLFQKKLTMHIVALAEFSSRIVLVLGIALAACLNWGLAAILWATVISSAVSFAFHYFYSRKFIRLRFSYDPAVWRAAIDRSWPLALTIVFNLIYLKTDTLILSIIKTQADVGIYGSSYKIIDVLVTLPFMFAGVILPILTANWLKKNYGYFQSVFQKAYDFMVILALPLAVGTQFLARDTMIIAAGQNFAAAGPVLRILILAASIIFLSCLFSHVIIAIGRQRKIIWAYVFTSVTAVAGYLIFIPKFSYFGAAWVTIYSEGAILIFAAYYAYKYTKFFPRQKIAGKALIASLGMGLFLFLVPAAWHRHLLGFGLIAALAIAVYFLLLYLIKGLTKNDFKMFWPQRDAPPLEAPIDNI